ncbi:hypothetical protein MP638_006802 [Amoeboaphelidium occidentale]|nr:hypothetical protein MP638_006802 [Amoeboaphelidium occidentale]
MLRIRSRVLDNTLKIRHKAFNRTHSSRPAVVKQLQQPHQQISKRDRDHEDINLEELLVKNRWANEVSTDFQWKKMNRWVNILHSSVVPTQQENDSDSTEIITVTREQESIIQHVTSNHRPNLFFTGQAGTGKSVLLSKVVKALMEKERQEYPDLSTEDLQKRIVLTASTGIAACRINGVTLHSWGGISPGLFGSNMKVPSLTHIFNHLKKPTNISAFRRWKNVKTLIIDECSMIHPSLLDTLDRIGKRLKQNNDAALGGIQLILCGDFMQLPPVSKNLETNDKIFVFDAACWKDVVNHDHSNIFELSEVFRQKGDPIFVDLLNFLRNFAKSLICGNLNSHDKPKDISKHQENEWKKFMVADALFHHLEMPFEERVNDPIFRLLSSPKSNDLGSLEDLAEYVYPCYSDEEDEKEKKFEGFRFKPDLKTDDIHCNDFLKRITSSAFKSIPLFPFRRDSDEFNNKRFASLSSKPVYSYHAYTQHPETNGLYQNSAERQEIEGGTLFVEHLKLRKGVQVMLLTNIKPKIGLVNGAIGEVVDFVKMPIEPLFKSRMMPRPVVKDHEPYIVLPRVKFPVFQSFASNDEPLAILPVPKKYEFLAPVYCPDKKTLTVVIFPFKGQIDQEEEKIPQETKQGGFRVQLPLRHAWSYSIHKSQGQTLQKIEVDINTIFEVGQFYVALSRGTSLCGIRLIGYDEHCRPLSRRESGRGKDFMTVREKIWTLMRHDRVVDFYRTFREQQHTN